MEFVKWLEQETNEDWRDVGRFVSDLPQSLFRAEKDLRERRRKKVDDLRKANKEQPTPEPELPVDVGRPEGVKEAQEWFEKLRDVAEKGRKKLYDKLMQPNSSVLAGIEGEEDVDPLSLILSRTVGYMGMGVEKVLHFLLMKVLHAPAMWKFFRHDTYNIAKDFVKSGWLVAKHPLRGKAWGAFGHHFLNLLRYPVAAFMMGLGMKLSYQQYQLIQHYGFTNIDPYTVGAANAIFCYFLFLCFLVPHWFKGVESAALKTLATLLKAMFPQQMYKEVPNKKKRKETVGTKAESLDRLMDDDLKFLCEDVSRYSIEVNYRTSRKEVLDAWAKLVLGFVSAALQREGYHVKHVYSEKPLRILVSTNNWDDGAWTAILMYNHDHEYFVISSGFWNKDRRTVSVQRDTGKVAEDTASELVSKLLNFMHGLKKRDPRKINTLKPAPMKRGPKK